MLEVVTSGAQMRSFSQTQFRWLAIPSRENQTSEVYQELPENFNYGTRRKKLELRTGICTVCLLLSTSTSDIKRLPSTLKEMRLFEGEYM